MRSMVLVLAATSLVLSTSRPADACSPPLCWSGAFVPGDDAQVPANAPALLWRPMAGHQVTPDPMNVVLALAVDPTRQFPLTAQLLASGDFLLAPDAPLTPGDYLLTDHTLCLGLTGPEATFTVTPAGPMPSDLGALGAYVDPILREIDLSTSLGSCSVQTSVASADLELQPSESARPWFDVLQFETWVDDKPWSYQTSAVGVLAPGKTSLGSGRDRVFHVCSSMDDTVFRGVAEGKHVVSMRATLPGSSLVVMSNSVEVTLQCDLPNHYPPDDEDDDGGAHASGGCSAGAGAGPWLGLALLALVRPARRRDRGARRRT
jgi:hypothetical protein